MTLSEKEKRALQQARIRNLKRKYSKLIQRPEMIEECIDLKSDIDALERELSAMT